MKRQFAVGRKPVKLGVVLLTLAVMSFTAAAALAANVSGDGVLVGTSGSDTIAAGNGADTIWGLGGSDTITVGTGSDTIDAGGVCSPTNPPSGDFKKLPTPYTCEHGPTGPPFCGTTSITGTNGIAANASGANTVYGNCGMNEINLGNGANTVFAFGGPNTVTVGNGSDSIYAYGTGSYTVGTGSSTIFAQFSTGDVITCGSSRTTVYTAKGANTVNPPCSVKFVKQQSPPGAAVTALMGTTSRRAASR